MQSPEFVVHGCASSESVESIKEEGFKFEEGRETVSADFFFGMDFAQKRADTMAGSRNDNPVSETDHGSLLIMRVPEGYRVDYGTETKARVDDDKKEVSGQVGKYSGGRKQLGIYKQELQDMGLSVEKLHGVANPLEKGSEILGREMDVQAKVDTLKKLELVLASENIVVEIKATPEIVELTNQLKGKISSFEIKAPEAAKKLADEIKKENQENTETVHHFKDGEELENILTQMLEGSLINNVQEKIRMLSLQMKMLQGYEIDDKSKIPGREFPLLNRQEVGQTLELYKGIISKEGFTTGIPKLDRYLSMNISNLGNEFSNL